MSFTPFAALQRTNADGVTRWFHYTEPVDVLEAWTPADAPAVLAEADRRRAGGLHAVGWIAYGAAPGFDPRLRARPPESGRPLARFTLYRRERPGLPVRAGGAFRLGDPAPELDAAAFAAKIHRIRAAIAAGETYQVNFTYPLRAEFTGDAWTFFRRLRLAQAARHQAYLEEADQTVVSASPECFFRLERGRIMSRPMKGTAAPGREAELLASLKNRAENIMIVDMIRNDLGKLARPGSVRADPLFEIERFPSLSQMTSTLHAEGPESVAEWMRALFPCASITGAPKRNTMDWIRELETCPRGIYTGCVGGLFSDGVCEFNVAIRTAVIRDGTLRYHTGCGIVWDSDPAEEYQESRLKTRVLRHEPDPVDLIETMRWTPDGGTALWPRHRTRLLDSAAALGFEVDPDELDRELARRIGSPRNPQRLRLTLAPDGALDLTATPLPGPTKEMTFALDTVPTPHDHPQLRHKTTRRDVYAEARARRPESEETLLVNQRGELMEFCIGNLLLKLDGVLVTPPRASGCLHGTARAEALEKNGVEERICTPADLDRAEEVHLINAVRGRVRMRRVS